MIQPLSVVLQLATMCVSMLTDIGGDDIGAEFIEPRLGYISKAGENAEIFDCGVLATFYIMKCYGRNVQLNELDRRLPGPHPEGYSMKELRDAAESLGLNLSGVHLAKLDSAIDRPMIVFLRRGEYGHFIGVSVMVQREMEFSVA